MNGLEVVLETLNAHYTYDGRGRMRASTIGGVPPRFVLGRSAEGCVWRMRADLDRAVEIGLARLAGRERGAPFGGELAALPERLAALERVLAATSSRGGSADGRAIRTVLTRDGVIVGELWTID